MQTAYLIAEVIAIPLSGFSVARCSTRVLLSAISAFGFTVSSLLCGFSSSIEQMILWRAIQGFLGAGMIPTVFASAFTDLPALEVPHRRRRSSAWSRRWRRPWARRSAAIITDLMSWHWLFFINIVPGIVITIGVLALVDFDQPNFALLERFDWWGLIFMGGFLGVARICAGGRPST